MSAPDNPGTDQSQAAMNVRSEIKVGRMTTRNTEVVLRFASFERGRDKGPSGRIRVRPPAMITDIVALYHIAFPVCCVSLVLTQELTAGFTSFPLGRK